MYDFMADPRFKGIEKFDRKVWLSSPTMHGDEQRWVDEAIQTNWVSTVGANINEIERQMAEYVGIPYGVALSSGTAALHLAIKLCGEKLYGAPRPGHGSLEGKRVFCSDMTFDATVNPVAYEGGEAVFIDTERDTWNMDPVALERAFQLYPDVRLIVVAHLYGTPGKIEEIRKIADAHNALIVEDAAESLGATVTVKSGSYLSTRLGDVWNRSKEVDGGRAVQTGTFGDIGIISFNGNKLITGSSSGMLFCREKADADKVRKWSTQSREAAPWYQHEELGYNYRASNITSAIVRGQIPYIGEHLEGKKRIYERYRDGLKDLPVSMNPYSAESEPNFWLSCLLIDEDAMSQEVRGEHDYLWKTEPGKSSPHEILDAMTAFGAEGRPIWKPMHCQPIYRTHAFVTVEGNGRGRTNAYIKGSGVDVGADIFRRGLCLPSDNKMTEDQQDRVIEIIHRCFE